MAVMDSSPLLIIANPASGGGRGRAVAERALARMAEHRVEARLQFTTRRGDAREMANRGVEQGIPRIVACGGDGTIHEIVNAVAGSRTELGLLPCGRGNDLARALSIPANFDMAIAALLNGVSRTIDLAQVNGRYFGTVATLGFDSEVARLVYEKMVPLSGTGAYILAVLRTLGQFRGTHLRMEGDFGVVDAPVLLTATGNTSTYGGGMKILPGATPDDGLLDICHVRMMNRFEVLRMFPTVFWGGHVSLPQVTMYRSTFVKLETPAPTILFADGEPVGQTPATIRIAPGQLRVRCPEQKGHTS